MADPALSEPARPSPPPASNRRVSQAKRRGSLGFETALKIEAAIAQADLPVGALIGTSQELARRYGVGRPTILVALRIVEFHGLARMRPGPGGGLIVAGPVLELVAGAAGRHLMLSGALLSEHVRDARAVLAAAAAELAAVDPEASAPRLRAWIEAHPLGRERQGRQDCHAVVFPCALAEASGNLAATLFSMIASTAVANVAGPDNPWVVTHDLAVWSREVELQILDAIRIQDAQGAARAACDYVRRLDVAGSPKYGPRPPEDTGSVVARTRAGQVARSIIFSLGAQRDASPAPNTALGTIDTLCRREGVCRATAVQALRMLEASGVISVKAGRNQGYFQKPIPPEAIVGQILAFLRSRPGSDLAAREFAAAYGRHRASVGGEGAPNPLLSIIDHVLEDLIPEFPLSGSAP